MIPRRLKEDQNTFTLLVAPGPSRNAIKKAGHCPATHTQYLKQVSPLSQDGTRLDRAWARSSSIRGSIAKRHAAPRARRVHCQIHDHTRRKDSATRLLRSPPRRLGHTAVRYSATSAAPKRKRARKIWPHDC